MLHLTIADKQIIAAIENNRDCLFVGKDPKSMNRIHKISLFLGYTSDLPSEKAQVRMMFA
jgi:hypothetical protein